MKSDMLVTYIILHDEVSNATVLNNGTDFVEMDVDS